MTKVLPEKRRLNAAFTVEGKEAYELGQSFATWLAGARNVTIEHMRYDFNFTPETEVEDKKNVVEKKPNQPAKAN